MSEAKVREVADGVAELFLPLPMRPTIVNVYVVRGRHGWTLIDTGMHTSDSAATFRAALDELGIAPTAIDRIVSTHHHVDHYGASGPYRELTRAEVCLHPLEAERAAVEDAQRSAESLAEEAKARHDEALASARLAEAELRRMEELHRDGNASDLEHERAIAIPVRLLDAGAALVLVRGPDTEVIGRPLLLPSAPGDGRPLALPHLLQGSRLSEQRPRLREDPAELPEPCIARRHALALARALAALELLEDLRRLLGVAPLEGLGRGLEL